MTAMQETVDLDDQEVQGSVFRAFLTDMAIENHNVVAPARWLPRGVEDTVRAGKLAFALMNPPVKGRPRHWAVAHICIHNQVCYGYYSIEAGGKPVCHNDQTLLTGWFIEVDLPFVPAEMGEVPAYTLN